MAPKIFLFLSGFAVGTVICFSAGVAGDRDLSQAKDRQDKPVYSFAAAPFISPKIIQDLSSWLSDGGDQVVAVNLLESQNSNRYFGDIKSTDTPGGFPYVYVKDEPKAGESALRSVEFGYRLVGKTNSGIFILRTSESGGGTGVFESLMLMALERDNGLAVDWDKKAVTKGKERLLIRKIGEITLGDRWDGDVRIEGSKLFVGKSKGRFANKNEMLDGRRVGADYVVVIDLENKPAAVVK